MVLHLDSHSARCPQTILNNSRVGRATMALPVVLTVAGLAVATAKVKRTAVIAEPQSILRNPTLLVCSSLRVPTQAMVFASIG